MISIVIPVFNEEQVVDELVMRTLTALIKFAEDFEVIFVDDGSTDSSLSKLLSHQKKEKRIKVIQLSKNYGHQAAYTCGLSMAMGEYLVMMDGDLQDPPELIEMMYSKLIGNELTDIVYAKRRSKIESPIRLFSMSIFHKVFNKIINIKNSDDVGNFAIFTRAVQEAILSYPEKIRYLPGIRFHVGFEQDFVLFDRDERLAGKSKMNYSDLFSLALDALFSFSNFPLRIMLALGFLGLLISFLGVVYVIVSKLIGIAPTGWSSTLFFIFFFSSLQIMFMGLLGEYIFRIYKEVQNRPMYIIKKIHTVESH